MKVKIVYATESGTTKYIAEVIQKELQAEQHQVDLHCLNFDKAAVELKEYDLVIFGAPTYDEGQPQAEMVKFMNSFNDDLSQKKIALFCLGESWYPNFCGAAEIMEKWILDHAGSILVPSLKIDGYPLDTRFVADWAKSVVQAASS